MSEETEVPIVCDDCGGNLTNAGGTIGDLFSMALGEDRPHYWHMEQSGCIASLNERLTAATERAEAAEAMRDDIIAICRGTQMDDAAIHSMRTYVEGKLELEKLAHGRGEELGRCLIALSKAEAERDALRKDAALLDALQAEHERFDPVAALVVKVKHDRNGSDWANVMGDIRAALTAALAVQPTTGGGDE